MNADWLKNKLIASATLVSCSIVFKENTEQDLRNSLVVTRELMISRSRSQWRAPEVEAAYLGKGRKGVLYNAGTSILVTTQTCMASA